MKWSEHLKGNDKVSYDHVKMQSPLGEILITWKSWKELPSFDIEIDSVWIGCEYNLIEAKNSAIKYLKNKNQELTEFLNQITNE